MVDQQTTPMQGGETPQQPAASPTPSELLFGIAEEESLVAEPQATQEKPQEVQQQMPVQQPPAGIGEQPSQAFQQEQPYDARNDDKRYEYWQSKADKLQNDLKEVQPLVEYVKQNPEVLQLDDKEPQQEEFPPPPEAPVRPRTFSREEAYTDPTSESARYLDEQEVWRGNMDQYNALQNQYQVAVMREQLDGYEKQRQQAVEAEQYHTKQVQTMKEVHNFVQAEYGLTPDEATEFVQTYSDPKSITMKNLVNLYRGGKQQPAPAPQPSRGFQQARQMQQVPSPMGVMPAQSSVPDPREAGNDILKGLIGDYNKTIEF